MLVPRGWSRGARPGVGGGRQTVRVGGGRSGGAGGGERNEAAAGGGVPDAAAAFFAGSTSALALYRALRERLDLLGPMQIRVSSSQVAFRRRRGFAWLWCPGRWLANPGAEVVLSLALPRRDGSPRWKEVVQPTPRAWMHHLELHDPADLDDQVAGWLAEAYAAAG